MPVKPSRHHSIVRRSPMAENFAKTATRRTLMGSSFAVGTSSRSISQIHSPLGSRFLSDTTDRFTEALVERKREMLLVKQTRCFSRKKPLSFLLWSLVPLLLTVFFLSKYFTSPPTPTSLYLVEVERRVIWNTRRIVEWRPCYWWSGKPLVALPKKSNGYIRVDCYGGLNQMRRDFCDGIGIARLLNATLILPKFEVAAYWNETSDFSDVFDVDYFIKQTEGFIQVLRELPKEIADKNPYRVDCSKRKGQFDYVEKVLPYLLKHKYISITPAMSQRRDRYPLYAKATLCQACYGALRLKKDLESKAIELLTAIPKPFLSLHLRFEPDMVAYSQCTYDGLSSASMEAINAARGDRKEWTGDLARVWRKRGKCPLTPNETALIFQALALPTNTTIYLAAGDGILELDGFTSVYTNVITKSSILSSKDLSRMHGNTKAALDYYISINSDAYIATYFGNMDKMVSTMRAKKGLYRTLFLNRKSFADYVSEGLTGLELMNALWKTHSNDFAMGRGSALPDCFYEFKL